MNKKDKKKEIEKKVRNISRNGDIIKSFKGEINLSTKSVEPKNKYKREREKKVDFSSDFSM